MGRGGVFTPLEDVDFFRRVQVDPEAGTLIWPNEVDFCPDVLYNLVTGKLPWAKRKQVYAQAARSPVDQHARDSLAVPVSAVGQWLYFAGRFVCGRCTGALGASTLLIGPQYHKRHKDKDKDKEM